MLRRSENVLCCCANKHQSCRVFGTGCLWAAAHSASQHAFSMAPLSSPAVSGQRYHYTPQQTLTLIGLCTPRVDDTLWCCMKSRLWSPSSHELFHLYRTSSILSHRHLKLQATPLLFIQAPKHSSGPPNLLNYSAQPLTPRTSLTAALLCRSKEEE